MDGDTTTGRERDQRPRPLDGVRVLAVEDHMIGRILLQAMLGPLGVEAVIVGDGQAARDAAKTQAFAVVLLDLGLPDTAGDRLAKELKELPGGRGAAFVAVTGRARPSEVPAPFVDWLEKPFSVRELAARLEALVPHHELSA